MNPGESVADNLTIPVLADFPDGTLELIITRSRLTEYGQLLLSSLTASSEEVIA